MENLQFECSLLLEAFYKLISWIFNMTKKALEQNSSSSHAKIRTESMKFESVLFHFCIAQYSTYFMKPVYTGSIPP